MRILSVSEVSDISGGNALTTGMSFGAGAGAFGELWVALLHH